MPGRVHLRPQLIDRQTAAYDPADIEDRYETWLREMIEAKLRGEGIDMEAPAEPARGNVVDLMAALKKSLGQALSEPAARAHDKAPRKSSP